MPRAHGIRRIPVVLATTIVLVITLTGHALGRVTAPEQAARRPAAATSAFTLDLSAPGDFVPQANFVQCVGASMQMMLNMIRPRDDRTARTQLDLQAIARSYSGERPDGRTRQGASVVGWTAGLNVLGGGPYRTAGSPDLAETLRMAARAMRDTNRPVGLLMWRGRHAWVMAGFTASADPRLTDDFDVTHVVVLDPLYPYGSKTWGASPEPRASLTVAQLGRQFLPRGYRGWQPGGSGAADSTTGPPEPPRLAFSWSKALAGNYVVVLPFTTTERPWFAGPLR